VNGRGVSVLVGFILLMLTLMIFVSILQAYVVPSVCKRIELRKLNDLMENIQDIDKNIMNDRLSTVTLDLGVTYPKYMFLITPPQMGSSVVAERFKVNLSYDEILPNGSVLHRTSSYVSDRIRISPNYFYTRGYEFVLENSAIYEYYYKKLVMAVLGQQMFYKDRIYVPILNATFTSFSSAQPVDIVIDPVSYGGYVLARNVTVSFETSCPEYWVNLTPKLKSMGYIVNVSGNKVTVSYANVTRLYITYTLLFEGISISSLGYNYKQKPAFIFSIEPTTNYNLTVDESITLGVEVLDGFNNPVRGYPVNVTLTGVGEVTPSIAYTDSSGVAKVTFTSKTAGKALINFSIPVGSVLYTINVLSSGVTLQFPYGVTYDANTPGALFAFGNYISTLPSDNTTPSVPLPTTNITKDDGAYLVSVAPLGDHAAQRFEIYGLNTSNVIETYVYWNGYGVGANYTWGMWAGSYDGESLYLWNYTSSRYDLIVYTDSSTDIWLSVGLNSTQMKNYIRNGKMIILVVQRGITISKWWKWATTTNSTLATDYVGVFQIYR